MVAPVDLKRTDYRTVLVGMKPEKTYHFRVVASDGTTTYASEDHLLATGAKNTASPIVSFSVNDAAKLARGFFVASFWNGTNAEMPFIFDTDGDVVWWYEPAPGESTDGVAQAKMSADGQSLWLVNEVLAGAPLRRVSIDGLTTQTYENTSASHAVAAVGGDTMVYLDYSAGKSACNPVFENRQHRRHEIGVDSDQSAARARNLPHLPRQRASLLPQGRRDHLFGLAPGCRRS